jgi:hypothetical protein
MNVQFARTNHWEVKVLENSILNLGLPCLLLNRWKQQKLCYSILITVTVNLQKNYLEDRMQYFEDHLLFIRIKQTR